jgi:hypothetical protein
MRSLRIQQFCGIKLGQWVIAARGYPRSTVERAIRITRHGGDDGRRPMFYVAVTQKGVSLIDPLPLPPTDKQARLGLKARLSAV